MEDFVPFTHTDLVTFGEDGAAQEIKDVEITVMAWICARFLKCVVPAKVVPMLETSGELFTAATFDDIAFLLLLFEDNFKVWMEMAAAKKTTGQAPVSKKVCRRDYKLQKTFKLGNGLSGKEAQKRYVVIRNRVAKYLKTPKKKTILEKRYLEEVQIHRERETANDLKKRSTTMQCLQIGMTDIILDDMHWEQLVQMGLLGAVVAGSIASSWKGKLGFVAIMCANY